MGDLWPVGYFNTEPLNLRGDPGNRLDSAKVLRAKTEGWLPLLEAVGNPGGILIYMLASERIARKLRDVLVPELGGLTSEEVELYCELVDDGEYGAAIMCFILAAAGQQIPLNSELVEEASLFCEEAKAFPPELIRPS